MRYRFEDGPIKGESVNSRDVGLLRWGNCVNLMVCGPTSDDVAEAVYVLRPFRGLRFLRYNAEMAGSSLRDSTNGFVETQEQERA